MSRLSFVTPYISNQCRVRIPNLPFFYLAYRAWSHWRALAGGKHIQFLCERNLFSLSPSPILDTIYTPLLPNPSIPKEQIADADRASTSTTGSSQESAEERMLLSQENGRQLVKALEIPELEVELERAIWQVETAIEKERGEKSKPPNTAESK
ncbi:hypothetical protein F5Y11DRAFT_124759 [Daldinia sp. FL1419]|nr:hypothetical protein F5Y11DRAFT_124759 [Daldinia sp. FL1419]